MKIYIKDFYLDQHGVSYERLTPLEEYCSKSVKKANKGLYELERLLSEFLDKPINLKHDLPEVRSCILNLSGQISRLCENIVIREEIE